MMSCNIQYYCNACGVTLKCCKSHKLEETKKKAGGCVDSNCGGATNNVWLYCTSDSQWKALPAMHQACWSHGVVAVYRGNAFARSALPAGPGVSTPGTTNTEAIYAKSASDKSISRLYM